MLRREGISLVKCDATDQMHHFDLESYPHTVASYGKSLPAEARTLIRVEPIVVNPYQYRQDTEKTYGKIVVISPNELKTSKNIYWQSGYIDFDKIERYPDEAKSGVAMINENKFSFVPGSNYKLRQKVIEEFSKYEIKIQLAGKNWDKGLFWQIKKQISAALISAKFYGKIDFRQYQSSLNLNSPWIDYVGQVESALHFLSQSKFAIVIENDSTYVSEKLLNALISGCIPLYVGPSLPVYDIPAGVAFRLESSAAKFVDTVRSTSESELERVRECGQNWITSREAKKRWSVNEGFDRLIEIMKTRIN